MHPVPCAVYAKENACSAPTMEQEIATLNKMTKMHANLHLVDDIVVIRDVCTVVQNCTATIGTLFFAGTTTVGSPSTRLPSHCPPP